MSASLIYDLAPIGSIANEAPPGVSFGCSADGLLVALLGDTAFAMVPGRDGRHFLATRWRIGRPIAEWRRDDFYGHADQLVDVAAFRAKVLEQAEHQCEKFALDRHEERSMASTPWGQSQGATVYADGVVFHSTAGHGGFLLSPERNRKIHRSLRVDDGAYEEDHRLHLSAPVHQLPAAVRGEGGEGQLPKRLGNDHR